MSKRKIVSALKRKGIIPTPSGFGCGWNIELLDETEDMIYDADNAVNVSTYMEFDNLNDVMEWIDSLPNLTPKD